MKESNSGQIILTLEAALKRVLSEMEFPDELLTPSTSKVQIPLILLNLEAEPS